MNNHVHRQPFLLLLSPCDTIHNVTIWRHLEQNRNVTHLETLFHIERPKMGKSNMAELACLLPGELRALHSSTLILPNHCVLCISTLGSLGSSRPQGSNQLCCLQELLCLGFEYLKVCVPELGYLKACELVCIQSSSFALGHFPLSYCPLCYSSLL